MRILDELSIRDFRMVLAFEEYESLYYQDGHFAGDTSDEGIFQNIAAKHLGVPVGKLSDNELRGI